MARRGITILEVLVAALFLVVGASVAIPLLRQAKTICPSDGELSKMKQQTLGVLLYAGDWDDRMPLADNWSTVSVKYLPNSDVRHCHAIPNAKSNGQFGHAFNEKVVGVASISIAQPDQEAMVIDSMDLWENAVSSLSRAPTYGRDKGQVTVGFLDGHVTRKNPNSALFK